MRAMESSRSGSAIVLVDPSGQNNIVVNVGANAKLTATLLQEEYRRSIEGALGALSLYSAARRATRAAESSVQRVGTASSYDAFRGLS
jgi:hypothetical protein